MLSRHMNVAVRAAKRTPEFEFKKKVCLCSQDIDHHEDPQACFYTIATHEITKFEHLGGDWVGELVVGWVRAWCLVGVGRGLGAFIGMSEEGGTAACSHMTFWRPLASRVFC